MSHFLAAAGRRLRRASRNPGTLVLRIDQFHRALHRERSRTDRTGRPFALLTFAFVGDGHENSQEQKLLDVLFERLRATDDVGYFDHDQIAVLLSGTSADEAYHVARGLCQTYRTRHRGKLRSQIYVYPSDGWLFDDEAEASGDRELTKELANLECRGIKSMEPLFLKPLPLWKRGLDLFVASLVLLVASPVMLLAAIAVRLTSPGPVIYSQKRHGLGGRTFRIYKFRSMYVDAEQRKAELMAANEQDGPAFKIRKDPRVTVVGRILRSTSIDELPQLWNVLRGEMSLVGPRPLPCDESRACEPWQRRRLDVTPGITCIWQIAGRSQVTFAEWVRMDLEYIRKRSLRFDLRLILMTIPAVLLRRGAC